MMTLHSIALCSICQLLSLQLLVLVDMEHPNLSSHCYPNVPQPCSINFRVKTTSKLVVPGKSITSYTNKDSGFISALQRIFFEDRLFSTRFVPRITQTLEEYEQSRSAERWEILVILKVLNCHGTTLYYWFQFFTQTTFLVWFFSLFLRHVILYHVFLKSVLVLERVITFSAFQLNVIFLFLFVVLYFSSGSILIISILRYVAVFFIYILHW